ncbi:hypothetical protein [Ornithinimicrobium cerasi]|nr:hypothetical protein [Ornithinimicrobium cerasi]
MAYRAVSSSGSGTAQTAPAGTAATFGDVGPTSDAASVTVDADDAGTTTADTPGTDVSVPGWVDSWTGSDADLLVIGDGYSSLPQQWVQLWAGIEGRDRPVTIRSWDSDTDTSFQEPVQLSEGEGAILRVWNASRSETTIAESADLLDRFDEASSDPEAVLVSLGQASGGEDVASGLDTLVDGLPDVPVLVVVGPAGLYAEGVSTAMSGWAEDHSDRVAVIDLSAGLGAQPTADEWAQAFAEAISRG